jgi:inner membrane protein
LLATYFTLIIASHGILDGFTNGGHGIAYFAPFINDRYFFSFNPLQVSTLSPKVFFTEQGFDVMKNEFIWLWLPTIIILIVIPIFNRIKKNYKINKFLEYSLPIRRRFETHLICHLYSIFIYY